MASSDLYRGIVLDHSRAPRNHGVLDVPTHASDGVNALCGDRIRLELVVQDGVVMHARFSGESCAITVATASMLTERIRGLDAHAIAAVRDDFRALVEGGDVAPERLGDLAALAELARYPARRKCALLPWATLLAALAGQSQTTTEKDSA